MNLLQGVGVPAGPVLDGRDMLKDPSLSGARGYFESVEHEATTGLGRQEYVSRGWRMSGSNVRIHKSAPLLGEDNRYVLSQVLGLGDGKIAELEAVEAVGTNSGRSANSLPPYRLPGR